MRDDEPYMPKMDWQQHKDAPHHYNVFIDGKQACHIKRRYRAGMEKVWDWSVFPDNFKRRMPKGVKHEGYEKTARLAVRRAEEAFEMVMQQPTYEYNPVINIPDQPPSHHRRRR